MSKHIIACGLNPYQRAVAYVYGDGDYRWLIKSKDWRKDLESSDIGDTLFKFLMLELATTEDCDSVDEAQHRISLAISDLKSAWLALEYLKAKHVRQKKERAA